MRNYIMAGLSLLLICAGMTLDYNLNNQHVEEDPTMPVTSASDATLTPQQKSLSDFFAKHGSPAPYEMAVAVSKTKRPALMAAISVRESNADPRSIGDKGKAKGAFQVWEQHWGPVPSDSTAQALQAEKILEELVQSSRGRLRSGLARYNGGDKPPQASYRYATWVIKKSREIDI